MVMGATTGAARILAITATTDTWWLIAATNGKVTRCAAKAMLNARASMSGIVFLLIHR